MMKIKIALGIFSLLTMGGLTMAPRAQAQDNSTKTTHKNTRTLTGCVSKGDGEKEFMLTTGKGATWEIKSDSVALGDHVGHTVTITGAVSNPMMHGAKEDAKDEMKEHGMDKNAKEHGHLTVTDLKMVSDNCKK